MNEHLQQLEALCHQPSMKVNSDQRATIVGNIVHYVMHPYFLQKSPEVQEKFRSQYLAHMQAIVGYCLREYVENSEPHLTIEFIKGLHRHLYLGLARVPVKTPDGSEAFMVPGEFKTSPCGISRRGKPNEFLATTAPELVAGDMEMLLELLYDERAPMFERYFRFIFALTRIHPFPDGNGKLAMLLGDLFLLKQGIHPPYSAKYKWENEQEIYELAERYSRDPQRDISIFYPWALKAYEFQKSGVGSRSIYDDLPSAFQTYVRRSGDKLYVVAQVFAKLDKQRLSRHFVVTDIGAGTGLVAEGILHGLLQHEGMALEYHYLEPSLTSINYFRAHSRHAALPEVIYHNIPLESFLLPSSDLILAVQTMQYLPSLGETLRNIVSALKPGGMALVVLPYPDGDEWQMLKQLVRMSAIYGHLKQFLDNERINYEEIVVESLVHISPADRNTPEGDDLLTFYFQFPPTMLAASTIEDFWAGVAEFARDGAVRKKEAFFWFTGTPYPV